MIISAAEYLLAGISASMRNGGSIVGFIGYQLWSFFECSRLSMAAQRTTSMMGRRILLLALAKVNFAFRETTASDSVNPVRAKEVMVYPSYLLPMAV